MKAPAGRRNHALRALNLETNKLRLDNLIAQSDVQGTTDVDKGRMKRDLEEDSMFQDPIFGVALQNLFKIKIPKFAPGKFYIRQQTYSRLIVLLRKINDLIEAHPNNEHIKEVANMVQNFTIRLTAPNSTFTETYQRDKEHLIDTFQTSLEIEIDRALQGAPADGQEKTLSIYNISSRGLLTHYKTPLLFVKDLVPTKFHTELEQNKEKTQFLNELFKKSIESDVTFWQVERGEKDDPRVFYNEIVYRLLNSMSKIPIHDEKANTNNDVYYLSLDSKNETKYYRVHPFNIGSIIRALGEKLRYPNIEVNEIAVDSDTRNVLIKGIDSAFRVRFSRNYEIVEEFNKTIKHPLYNLTARETPYRTFQSVMRAKPATIAKWQKELNKEPNRSLLQDKAFNFQPEQVTDIVRKRTYNPHQGQFFPFFNKSKYDLSRYQIPKCPGDLTDKIYEDACLIHCIKESKIMTNTELQEMDSNTVTRQLRPAKMQHFFANHGIEVRVKTLRDSWIEARLNNERLPPNKYKISKFGGGEKHLDIFLICGHFMLDEKTPITKFSFEKRDEFMYRFHTEQKRAPNGMLYDSRDDITYLTKEGYPQRDRFKPTMSSSDLVTELYIAWRKNEEHTLQRMYFDDVSSLNAIAFKDTKKRRRNVEILERLVTEPIEDIKRVECRTLEFTKSSTRPLLEHKKRKSPLNFRIFYADFEACVANENGEYLEAHVPYMCCIKESETSGNTKATFTGDDCGLLMLRWVLNGCPNENIVPLIYFHNLSYDINFLLKYGINSAVNRNSLILQADIIFDNRQIRLKDSYGLLSMPLRSMARSFKIDMEKEIFPYTYYSPERLKTNEGDIDDVYELEEGWNDETKKHFEDNLTKMGQNLHKFDMMKYCEFYCERDVEVLQKCIDIFHQQIKDSFSIDCHRVISISSVADKFLRQTVYYPFGQMYMYSNHIRDFLLDGVHGGRVMCARNERHHFVAKDREHGLWDLDAVSLYPSAMSCLWTVGGTPEPLQYEELDYEYLRLNTAITAYVVEIYITKIGIPRDFPLVIYKDPVTGKITNTNTPPVRMTVCDIELEDLIEFQNIEFTIIRGLKWYGPKDYRLQNIVKELFNKRAEYKKQKNPLENSYKLLLNSIYGKTIQKAIDHVYKYYTPDASFQQWLVNHSNFVESITKIKDSDIIRVKEITPINKHFNNTLLGIQILAMSKRLMNQLMCLADDLHIDVYYQDTDSIHVRRDCVPALEQEFFNKYHRQLRGTNLCQFHPDFDPIDDKSTVDEITAIESYFLGKKLYLDKLCDDRGNIGFHVRMKGVSQKSIEHEAKGDYLKLYRALYEGETIVFDLCCDGQVKFDNAKDGTVKTKNDFKRAVKATANMEAVEFEKRWEINKMI